MANLPLLLRLADDFASSPFYEAPLYYIRRPAAYAAEQARSCEKQVARSAPIIGKDGFQVCMDVQQFKPNELNVKVVDNCVIVEGKHEEREDDHGYISRHFVRRYALPKGYDPNKVVSTLSSDGVLSINVPKPQIEDKSNERQIQIQQVGPAHLNVKENPKVENDQESGKGGKTKDKP